MLSRSFVSVLLAMALVRLKAQLFESSSCVTWDSTLGASSIPVSQLWQARYSQPFMSSSTKVNLEGKEIRGVVVASIASLFS